MRYDPDRDWWQTALGQGLEVLGMLLGAVLSTLYFLLFSIAELYVQTFHPLLWWSLLAETLALFGAAMLWTSGMSRGFAVALAILSTLTWLIVIAAVAALPQDRPIEAEPPEPDLESTLNPW